jgi:hypothetical protein
VTLDAPEWRFEGRAVLGTFEATRLPAWLGGAVVWRGRARGRAQRAVARTWSAVHGSEESGARGLVGAFETDPRRHVAADPFLEETPTGVRSGYDFRFAVALDADGARATWPGPGTDRAMVREALADTVREALTGAGVPPASVTVERRRP